MRRGNCAVKIADEVLIRSTLRTVLPEGGAGRIDYRGGNRRIGGTRPVVGLQEKVWPTVALVRSLEIRAGVGAYSEDQTLVDVLTGGRSVLLVRV